MNKKELIEKLEDIEWEDFEVKEAKSEIPKSSWETVSAFSNTAGGWLIFGIHKLGQSYSVIGVENPEKIEQDFINVLRGGEKFNKTIDAKCKKYKLENKPILAFYIPQKNLKDKPVYFNTPKNTFIRTGSGDQRATNNEVDYFYRGASFEEKDKESTKYNLSHLDSETIKQYRNFFYVVNPTHRYNGFDDKEFLQKLGIVEKNKLSYGGLFVFGKDDSIAEATANYRIEYIEIDGTSYEEAPSRYSYRLSSEKNLFLTFFDIYERLVKKTDVSFSIRNGIRDDDPPNIQAIREALVNLIIHTDYFSKANPRIRYFSDRIEFFNPGGLPKNIELILKEDFSLPRNPVIAKIFRFIKFAENIGSGFSKMINGWDKKYHIKPIIEGDFDFYKITFPTTTTAFATTTKTTTYTTTNKDKENTPKTGIKASTGDNDRQKEILKFIAKNPYQSIKEIAAHFGLTTDGIRYHVKIMKSKGKIKRKGHGKGGSWIIIDTSPKVEKTKNGDTIKN